VKVESRPMPQARLWRANSRARAFELRIKSQAVRIQNRPGCADDEAASRSMAVCRLNSCPTMRRIRSGSVSPSRKLSRQEIGAHTERDSTDGLTVDEVVITFNLL
jgi:hypothetical protein